MLLKKSNTSLLLKFFWIMTTEEEKTLHQFEARVRQLLMRYKSVVQENSLLKAKVEEQKNQISDLEQNIAVLEQRYSTLKMAKMFEVTSADTETAQKRIAKLIREVDKCIAMLNV